MIRLVVLLTMITGFSVSGFAQESDAEADAKKRAADVKKRAGEVKQRAGRSRGPRRPEPVAKDPAGFAKTQDKEVFSGPQKGEKVPGFNAIVLSGKEKGSEVDPVAAAGKKPQVLIFQDDNGVAVRGLFGMVSAISGLDKRSKKVDLQITSILLGDDKDKLTAFGSRFANGLVERGLDTMVVSKDGRNGPGSYGLNRNISQTIILVKDGKVLHNFVFPQGSLFADPHVLGGIAELLGEKRETVTAWLKEQRESDDKMRMSRSRERMREGESSGPTAAFRAKLGELVKAGKITREEAGELWKAAYPQKEEAEK